MPCTHGNLGANAQNRRLRMSLVALLVGLGLSVVMMQSGAPTAARWVLFFPFFSAAFGAYQGLYRTCSFAAHQGVRLADHGEEVVVDPAERDRMRREGRRVLIGSLATAAAATAMVVLLP
ncbi:MAG TPA: hypothetical protein VK698_21445 [Kofleriaceae bacterium]|nr:hypothetical protein [Kofleriaceae bacterium]